ncbi:hypothetical protein R8871_05643 [Paraburkholderia graminis C4D1M]|uniref:Toxin VasX N-terminal region domain-containing protein n=1 Tax=Paraburkholderia graminis (strain ATCC 700544 / DSM 17151 / LMG 18924 / NCIMB 13744 / C4D1M) TaxID=396598 RepID=B1G3S1_PARG4|nr:MULTISPECIES: T6SS effector BTH_I2691 family protein [Paraburkholderia]AXE90938.1 hypothetical protein CUJ90_00100 [Paraburkholderia terricola]EDT09293.1 conserved hypothetical protein [Paraburkholderia graminis C4D1M]CAB3730017.1 hypothetical protein R8871_05643 [Paraburkholderia graminis C4D1M]
MATASNIPKVQAASANAKANAAGPTSCDMCEKKGLLILPVRYAAAAASGAHNLGGATALALPKGQFGDGVTAVGAKKASYFLRSVRKGFIHVYYPSTNKWQIYGVTTEGYVFNYPLDADLSPAQEKAFSCKQAGHMQLAQCISIEQPKKAGKVYLAFSDVRWTAPVRKRYETNESGCRDHRMQMLDAAGWAGGNHTQKHAEKIDHLADFVLEYKGGLAIAASGSPFHFMDRTGQAQALKDSMDSHVKGQGLFFALWDPAGITQEINTEQVLAYGAAMAPYQRKLWTASAIEGLKTAIEESAEQDENAAAEQLKGQAAESYALYSLFDGGKAYERQVQSIDTQTEREMESVKTAAWKPYTESYSPNAVTQFRNDMKKNMQQVEDSTLNPIADDHVAWLKSTALKTVFAFDYHEHDPVKGIDYAELFHACIADSADRKQVFDLILQWAQGDVMDRHNPLLRSLVLNHNPTAEKVKEAAAFPLTELREPLAKLIESNNVTNEILEREEAGLLLRADKVGASIIHQVGGPVANFIARGGDAVGTKVFIACMCLRTKTTVVYKPVEGNLNQWLSYMAREIYEQMPANRRPSLNSLKDNLRKSFKASSPQDGPIKVPQYVLFNADEALAASAEAKSGRAIGNAIFGPGVRAVLTEENVTSSFLPKFRAVTQGEVGYGAIGVIFNGVNWMLASKELEKSSALNRTETQQKFWAAIVSTWAAGGQTVGSGFKALGKLELRYSAVMARYGKFIEIAGRTIGAVAGLIGAWYDYKQSQSEMKQGHAMLARLYGASAIASAILCVATIAGATSLVLPLMIILIVIGILIAWKKHREIDEWLSKCIFGTGDEHFSAEDERKQFEALTS